MISQPARGTVLLKPVETEETLAGGSIIIPEKSRERMAQNQHQVVAVGLPEICEYPTDCDHDSHELAPNLASLVPIDPRIIPEAWVIVRSRSLVDAGDGQYLVRQDQVLGVFTETNDD